SFPMPFTEAVVCCCHGLRCVVQQFHQIQQNDGFEVMPYGEMFCPDEKLKCGRGKRKKEQDKNSARDLKASRRKEKKDTSYESVLSYSETSVDEAKSRKKSKRKYTAKNVNDIGSAVDLYLGAMAAYKAERETRKRSTFKLYHKFPRSGGLSNLDSVLQLMICYRTSSGNYKHFPVRSRPRYDGKILYYVEHDCDEASVLFESIEKLTRYYQAYPLIELKPHGAACIELFPA
ncbi:hypothetical protein PENTCL1PPCAC_6240, partial [Pristionchus entomophagus]